MNILKGNSEKTVVKKYLKFFKEEFPNVSLDDGYFDRKGYTYYHFHKHVVDKLQGKVNSDKKLKARIDVRHGNLTVHGEPYQNPFLFNGITVMFSFLAILVSIASAKDMLSDYLLDSSLRFTIGALIIMCLSTTFWEYRHTYRRTRKAYSHLMLEVSKELKIK